MSLKGLKKSTFEVAAVKIAGIAIAFLLQVYLARVLTIEWFGEYVFVVSLITFLSLPAGLGLNTAAIRYVSGYLSTKEFSLLSGFVKKSVLLTALSVGIVSIVYIAGVYFIYENTGQYHSNVLYLAVLLLPVVVGIQMITGVCQGLHKTAVSQVVPSIIYPVLTGLFVFLFVVAFNNINAASAIKMTSIAGLVTILGGALYLSRNKELNQQADVIEYKTKEWLSVGFSTLLVSASMVIIQQTDILMLGIIKGAAYSGLYAPATKIAMIVILGINLGHMMFAPHISSKYALGEIHDLQAYVTKALKYILGYTFATAFLVAMLGRYVLSIYGDEFINSYSALMILVIAYTLVALTGLGGFFLTLTGRHWVATRLSGICALINILLNYLLIQPYGIVGAALATAITTTVLAALLAFEVWKGLGIDPTFIALFKKRIDGSLSRVD